MLAPFAGEGSMDTLERLAEDETIAHAAQERNLRLATALRELNPRLDESVFDGGRATLHRMVDEPEPKKSSWKRLLGG
jgi:hypothetical protein